MPQKKLPVFTHCPLTHCWFLLSLPPSLQHSPVQGAKRVVPSVQTPQDGQKVVTPLQETYPCVLGQLRSTATQVAGGAYEQVTEVEPQLAMQVAFVMVAAKTLSSPTLELWLGVEAAKIAARVTGASLGVRAKLAVAMRARKDARTQILFIGFSFVRQSLFYFDFKVL